MKFSTLLLFIASAAMASVNKEGLPGIHNTFSAEGLGHGHIAIGANSHIIDDEAILRDGSVFTNNQGGFLKPFLMANNNVFLGMGLGSLVDFSLALPFYYQDLTSANLGHDDLHIGDLKYRAKFQIPYSPSREIMNMALLLGGTVPTHDGPGVIPTRLEYYHVNNPQATPYGVDVPTFLAGLGMTFHLNDLSKQARFAWHLNAGLRKTGVAEPDFDDILFAGTALDLTLNPYIGFFSELWHEARANRWGTDDQFSTEMLTLTIGALARTPIGFNFQAGLVLGMANEGYTPVRYPYGGQTNSFDIKGSPDASLYFQIAWNGPIVSQDKDGDGVPDKKDLCPDLAQGPNGKDGCPIPDTDGDGICDPWVRENGMTEQFASVCTGLDQCPAVPQGADGRNGCPHPDRDKDGICDPWVHESGMADEFAHICKGTDKCPDVAQGESGTHGCPTPDKDGDGICDPWVEKAGLTEQFASVCKGVDKCPDVAQGTCEKCKNGCPNPDTDGDGICDPWVQQSGLSTDYAQICKGSDNCPEVPQGKDGKDGCPAVVKVEETIKTIVLRGVNFHTGSARLTDESFSVLDNVVAQLKDTKVKIEVSGHTDDRGSAALNQRLSQERAQSVADYFVQKGISPERLRVIGYGPARPVGSNRTAEGRAMNRRVELQLAE